MCLELHYHFTSACPIGTIEPQIGSGIYNFITVILNFLKYTFSKTLFSYYYLFYFPSKEMCHEFLIPNKKLSLLEISIPKYFW